jgi:hypothetical protein
MLWDMALYQVTRRHVPLFIVTAMRTSLYSVFQKEFYNGIPNVTARRVLRKRFHLEQWIACTPLSVNVIYRHKPIDGINLLGS